MLYQVSEAQLKGWQHPIVEAVVEAAKNKSDAELKQVLFRTAFGNLAADPGSTHHDFFLAWNGFIRLPLTEESEEGKRIGRLWEEIKKEYPRSAQVSHFGWFFWRPEHDQREAVFVCESTGKLPMFYELAA